MNYKIKTILSLVSLLVFPSCSELASVSTSLSSTSEGGNIPQTFQYQNYKFRSNAAFLASQLGAVGVRQKSGHNIFVHKEIPKISKLALAKTASFTRGEGSNFKMMNELSLSDIKNLNLGGSQGRDSLSKESGIYTIYYIANIRNLVDQLNLPVNKPIRKQLQLTKESRIITAVVKVSNHTLYNKVTQKVDAKAVAALQVKGTATADTKNGNIQIADKKNPTNASSPKAIQMGLKIANGDVRAYEYSRVIWNTKTGEILDLIIDRPSPWYTGDASDHHYEHASNNPRDIDEEFRLQ